MTQLTRVSVCFCAALLIGGIGCGSNAGNPGTGGSGGSGSGAAGTGTAGTGTAGTGTAGASGTDGGGSAGTTGEAGTTGAAGAAAGTGGGAAGVTGNGGRGGASGNAGRAGTSGSAAGTTGTAGRGGGAGTSAMAGRGGGTAGTTGAAGTGGRGGLMCRAMETCTPGDTCEGECNARGLHLVCACPTNGQLLCATVQCPSDGGAGDGGLPICPQGTSTGDSCDTQTDDVCTTACNASGMNRTCLCSPTGSGRNGDWACTALMACMNN
jgi:hypothetical protein